jgi:hypothetical protein
MRILRIVLLLALFVPLGKPVDASDTSYLSTEEAAAEVSRVAALVLEHHPDPFAVTPRATFEQRVDQLLARKGPIAIGQQYFDLSSLLSLAADTHTQLHTMPDTPGFESTYPLRFRRFDDGLYVIAGDEYYRDLIGARVVSIGGVPSGMALARLASAAIGESDVRRAVFAESYLYIPETYAALGLTDEDGTAQLDIETLEGERRRVKLDHTWDRRWDEFGWDTLNPFLPQDLLTVHDVLGTEAPFYLQHIDDNYWFTFLDDQRYMYLQVNLPFPKEDGETPMEFHLRWIRALHDSDVEVLIIDLRNNPGGSINLAEPIPGLLAEQYFAHPTLRGVAVLISTDTVSAGSVLAARLESAIRPVFIGTPTGSAPNLLLEPLKEILPHSRFQVSVSRQRYVASRESDSRRAVYPDLRWQPSFDDYANGRDGAIDLAKSVDKELRTRVYAGSSVYTPWLRDSQTSAEASFARRSRASQQKNPAD